jgi:glycosyltransferase involved in cell wall biosynthesis
MNAVPLVQEQAQTMVEIGSPEQHAGQANSRPLLSIVTPAYNEADNLPLLYKRLSQVLDSLDLDWEWVVVDDHSADRTFAVIMDIAGHDPRVHGIRFARNFGSYMAITCGLHHAKGNCAVALAADLEDPPETIPELLAQWRQGAQVVWAARGRREHKKMSTIVFSRLYYFLMRHFVGLNEMPATGADFFLIDRHVMDAFRRFNESNVSIMALITWMGFRQATITYDKQARLHGQSGWSLEKKLKLVVDSVTSFSYLPIRLMSYLGFIVALVGFLYAGVVTANALTDRPPQGWASLMVVVLVLSGTQMLMMGVLGEYLWRVLDESRRRPRYLIEAITGMTERFSTGTSYE